jgi:succinyl-diaminopimelate desuccinylase
MIHDPARLRERLIQLTRDLVLIESTHDLPEERRRCFQLLRNHLDEVPGLELRTVRNDGFESLIALPEGVAAPDVLFCGHLDVVKHLSPGSYRSEIRDGRIFGPGTGDMKGQLAIMVELIRRLNRDAPGISVGLAVSSDEELGGEHGVRFLVEEIGLRCGVAVIPDGGSLHDVTAEEKGIMHLRLEAAGVSAHAARPWHGVNALDRLLDGLARIREPFAALRPERFSEEGSHWFPTCTPTIITTANDSANRIPGRAAAVIDVRFVPPARSADLLGELRALLGEGLSLEPIVVAEPSHLDPDPRFLEIVAEVTGSPARLNQASGGSDGRFFAAVGISVLLSRPQVGNLHGRDEWIEIESMMFYFEICRRYAMEKCAAARPPSA